MAVEVNGLLDKANMAILAELQQDARISFSELGRRVKLSTPAVTERVRRLEEAGIISGYGAKVDLAALGFPITALIELEVPPTRYNSVLDYTQKTLEIRECYFVTGESSFVARVVARSVQHLQEIIQQMSIYGSTKTSVVLSAPIVKHHFIP